jgi:hypothetical protein
MREVAEEEQQELLMVEEAAEGHLMAAAEVVQKEVPNDPHKNKQTVAGEAVKQMVEEEHQKEEVDQLVEVVRRTWAEVGGTQVVQGEVVGAVSEEMVLRMQATTIPQHSSEKSPFERLPW